MSNALMSLKCPSCGGNVSYSDGDIAVECPYCATQFLIKDALKARSIDRLASAIEKTAKPSMYDIEVQRAALNFARIWNNGVCNPFEAYNALNGVATLCNDTEVKTISDSLSEVIFLHKRFEWLTKLGSLMQRATVSVLIILGFAFLYCANILHNTFGIVICLVLAGFWFLTRLCVYMERRRLVSQNETDTSLRDAVTNSLNTLLSRFSK